MAKACLSLLLMLCSKQLSNGKHADLGPDTCPATARIDAGNGGRASGAARTVYGYPLCAYADEPSVERVRAETWLGDLKATAYEADDIVDEFRYAMLRVENENNRPQNGEKVRTSFFSFCELISGRRLPLKGGMRERVTGIVSRIIGLVERSTCFISQKGPGLMPGAEGSQDPTLSSMKEIDPIIVGRDENTKHMVKQLLDWSNVNENTIEILPIVGLPGIRKTTLARSICGHPQIKNHFQIILWVDVGDEFDVARIAKSMIDQVIGKDCCLSEGDTDLLGHRIYQGLSGKRYLLVLDDVRINIWNSGDNEKWLQLKSWLEQSAATGSSLIVTSTKFSWKWSSDRLWHLKNDDLWTLFCKRACIDDKNIGQEELKIIKKILKGCDSPLLVNLMGGLMRFKKDPAEWRKVINQLERYPQYHYSNWEIIMLCINHLSSEIKECFAFCSVFPEGHYMDKEVLVNLWMANGLISSNEPTSLEEKGNHIFNELVLRHIFEDVKLVPGSSSRDRHGYRSRVICKMHREVHESARYVSQYKYIALPEDSRDIPEIRCLSIPSDAPVDIPMLLQSYPDVRTLIYLNDSFIRTVNCNVMPKSNSLRALHLHSALIDRDLFELKYTKHLRYLDLSGSRIKRLPEFTSSLYFLQTLNLSKCLLLCRLPEDMRYMRSLRHLYVNECPKLKKMPIHLGQLSCLKILTTYIVGESAGNGIDEIKCLNLSGLLEIYNMHKVKDATIAKKAQLFSKTNLEMLTLCWGRQQLVMSKENNALEVLEALQPHRGLKVLKIQQYMGNEFANWLAYPVGLPNLVELYLIGCSKCSTIPAVWKLPSLQVLCLKHMINLICMSSFTTFPGIDEKDSSKLFPSLKRLVLVGLKRLLRWHEGEAMQRTILSFPVLDEMEITNCPELQTMPSVPRLKFLTISIENYGLLRSAINWIIQSKSLVELNIAKASGSDNEALSTLGEEVDKYNSHKLRVMRLDSTNSFFMKPHLQLGFWRSLGSLENLDIFNCSSIVDWPLEEFRNLGKLKRLSVRKCPNLIGSLPRQLQEDKVLLPLLQSLEFYGCPSLKEVPRCSSILYLELDECPEINSISGLNYLKMLFLSCTSWTSLPTGLGGLGKLESLRVSECYGLTSLPADELAGLTSLQTLIIDKCPRVKSLPEGLDQMLSGLGKFQISECLSLKEIPRCSSILYLELDECPEINSISGLNNLKMLFLSCTSWMSLPTGLGDLKKLESLQVSKCNNLKSLPNELAGLTLLQTLIINKCPRVTSLPEGLDQMLSGLGKFQISECPDLEKFCHEGPYSCIISQIGKRRNDPAGPSTDA